MATSKLQRYTSKKLSIHYGGYTIRENYRPGWLSLGNGSWLELDFFIEELGMAIEVQGQQHYAFIPFFHGTQSAYEKQKTYDRIKRERCAARDVRLYEVFCYMDVDLLIQDNLVSQDQPGYLTISDQPGTITGEPPTKKINTIRITKAIKTIVSYRGSDPDLLRIAHDKLWETIGNDEDAFNFAKKMAKKIHPSLPSPMPNKYRWLWE